MKHGFVRDIIRNQLDRDAYEQRWQQQQLEKKKQEEEDKKTHEEEHRKKRESKGRKSDDPLTTKSWGHDGYHELTAMEEKEASERSKRYEEQEERRRLSHEERMKTRKPLTDSQPLYVPPSRREGYKPRVSSGNTPEASPSKDSDSKSTPGKPSPSPLEKTPTREQEVQRRPQKERSGAVHPSTPTQTRSRHPDGNSKKSTQPNLTPSKADDAANRASERIEGRVHQRKEDASQRSQYRRKDQTPSSPAADAKSTEAVELVGEEKAMVDVENASENAQTEMYNSDGGDEASFQRDGEDPILFVGIELPDGQTAKMTVFKGDDPRTIAEEFCTKHSLSEIHIETIRQNIEYQLAPSEAESS